MTQKNRKGGCLLFVYILLVVAGFIFLLKGCLAKHDEYTHFDKAQAFHNSQLDIVLYLKQHFIVNSYSSEGGMTNISGRSIYFLETRNAATLELIKQTRLKSADKKNTARPTIIGSNEKLVWVFYGEIMAFDPFTHEIVCDAKVLAQVNPVFRNNLPGDSRYYNFNYILNRLEITTKDANKYLVNNFFATEQINESENNEPKEITGFKRMVQNLKAESSKEKKTMDYWTLQDSIRTLEDIIYKKTDEYRRVCESNKKINDARHNGISSINDMMINVAVIDSLAYTLLTHKEFQKNDNSFYFSNNSYEDVQKKLYIATIQSSDKNSGFFGMININGWKPVNNAKTYLNGGFLIQKETLEPICLNNPLSWIILSSKEVGNESPRILQRVNQQGIPLWIIELPVKGFNDMLLTRKNLVLFINDSDILTKHKQSNWIMSVSLETGEYTQVDMRN